MENFIREYYVEDLQQCKKAIEWFEDNTERGGPGRFLYTGENSARASDNELKESYDMSVDFQELYNVPCFAHILDCLWNSVLKYAEEFEEVNYTDFSLLEEINLQRYEPPTGGFKVFHNERGCMTTANRFLVWMIYLNTVTDKGGTEFKYLNHTEDAVEGKIIIWPTDFTHTHRGVVSPTQKKYILTGWYSFYK